MRRTPVAVWAVVGCALPVAALCARPALEPAAHTPWRTVALLALLYTVGEHLWRCGRAAPAAALHPGSFFPVLLAGAFLLPPAAAALVAVPGALTGRVDDGPALLRRVWHAAQLALAACAAAHACDLVGLPLGLGSARAGESPLPLSAPEFPGLLLPALAAALVFRAVLGGLDAVVVAAAERLHLRALVRRLRQGFVPHLVHGLAGLMMAVLWSSPYGPVSALLVLLPMYVSCWVFAQYHREQAAHQATIRALVQAVDIKDRYTRGHSERVGRASALIARELGMAEERQEVLRFAGILHDVGKLGVPTRILRKDGPLTADERRVIELHPEYGHEIVRGIGFLEEARAAILHHHERLDGGGYPYGLAGREIPEFARVVAVADAFDAMTSNRSYRRARAVPAALAELERCAGKQFDPAMVRALAVAIERHGWHVAVTSDAEDTERADTAAHRAGTASVRPGATDVPASDRPVPSLPREGSG